MAAPIIKVFSSESQVSTNLCDLVITKAKSAIKERGIFTVGVSGGSAAKFLCDGLPQATTDWSKWRVFFCDERHVPFSDPECTYSFYKTNLLSKVPLSVDHIFPLNPELSETFIYKVVVVYKCAHHGTIDADIPATAYVEQAAEDYEKKLHSVFTDSGLPRFDVLVLGMGPDGHTCSLFPGHPLLQETQRIAAPISDSPKPPPQRVTLTFPVINNTACAVFASCGAGKADIVQQVLENTSDIPLPATRVRPTNGEVIWMLDEGAAEKLKSASNKL